jgi:hypothetical protein
VVNKNNGNPFDVTIRFQKPHDGITKIALKNAQIPIGFYNIRSPYNTLTIGGTTYTISPGNYNSVTLLSALNSATSLVGSWNYIASTNQVQFSSTSGSVTLVVPSGVTLATLLGFTATQTLTGTTLVSTNAYIINFDTYINIYFDNIGRPSLEPSKCTFKIPINVNNGSILQWSENNQDDQYISVRDNESIDRIVIAVYDRFGNLINNNGLDWSFTLQVTSSN